MFRYAVVNLRKKLCVTKLEARGIVHVNGGVQIVYGNMASNYATQMRELLGME